MHGLLTDEYTAEFMKLLALQKIGMQGFPPPGANPETVDYLRGDAIAGVKEFGRSIMPWLPWPTPEQVQKSQEDQLAGGAQELIDAWIRNFDPDNADAYKATSGDS